MPAGRPSSFKPEYVEQAEKLCLLGATDDEIGAFFKVSTRQVHRWKMLHPEFGHSLKVGKELADDRVKRSLYQRAVGYRQKAVKIFMPAGREEPVYAPFVEQIAPDTTAAIFWLKNRCPEEFRDRQHHEHTGKDGGPIQVADMTDAELEQIIRSA